MMDSGFLNLKS